ncbi:hypothetical protein [Bacterioplanoides pacificum]|uniref:Transmembrane protein n=1 Tax=Bacterioplanoides pacificum TaxID=1171596 RepID=A0ABV7VT07_9GAMM
MRLKYSKFLFFIEILILMWPALWGLMLAGGFILSGALAGFSYTTVLQTLIALFIATALLCGSWLSLRFLSADLHHSSRFCWIVCTLAAVLSLLSLLHQLLPAMETYNFHTLILAYGSPFVVPLIHLYCESLRSASD